ncbi:MAG TPA: glycogen synthase GlgA [Rhodocyclaceae bacterium]|mgnify:CR=1 FL=1|nr:glycogen synthase GlgA [Rhodocyclaceae bacterium]
MRPSSSTDPLRVLFAVSEIAPWVKTGGLGDVAAALPSALRAAGIDVRVLVPLYPALAEAFPDAPPIARLPAPGGLLPAAMLREAVTPDGTPLLLLDSAELYACSGNPYLDAKGQDLNDNNIRFGLLSRVAALLGSTANPLAWQPQIIHCNDWQTALAPVFLHYLHTALPHAKTLVTIHNLAFQGLFAPASLGELGLPPQAWAMDGVEFHDQLSFLKGGLQHADWITTVSPTYAKEICSDVEGLGMGLAGLLRWREMQLSGILNGIDETVWNPAGDPYLTTAYDADNLSGKALNKTALQHRCGLAERDDLPLFGVVSRLTEQKGLDLLVPIAAQLAALPAQLIVLGSGTHELEQAFRSMAIQYPGQFSTHICFDEAFAHQIEAGADIFLMPSRFEPCGLNQMYSLRYGTPPLVRNTGGLADTVIDTTPLTLANGSANGFVFDDANPDALLAAIHRATKAWHKPQQWQKIQRNGMIHDWSWREPAQRYAELYRQLVR